MKHSDFQISLGSIDICPDLEAWFVRAKWSQEIDFSSFEASDVCPPSDIQLEALASNPRIKCWREAYRSMGLKPSKFQSSIEQLTRRALKGVPARTGIALVDFYNAISVRYAVPMGAYDAIKLGNRPLSIRPLREGDSFEPIGEFDADINSRILGYCQDDQVLCWALNYRDSILSAVDENTTAAIFISESVDRTGLEASRLALSEVAEAIRARGGTCTEPASFLKNKN